MKSGKPLTASDILARAREQAGRLAETEAAILTPLILTAARILLGHLRDIRDTATGVDLGNLSDDIADLAEALEPFNTGDGPEVKKTGGRIREIVPTFE